MKGLLDQFLVEAGDLLEQVDGGLLHLERDPQDRALLDEVFRAAHTLKGSSGLFEMQALTRLTHAAEDLLDAVRAERLALTAEMTDDLLAAFDLVRRWLQTVEQTGDLPADAATEGAALSLRLRAPIGGEPAVVARVPAPRAADENLAALAPAPSWLLTDLGASAVEQLRAWLEHARTRARVLRYTPGEQCFFAGEDPLHLVAQIPAVEAMHIAPSEPWGAPESFDEYRCLLVFTLVTRATMPEMEYLTRYVPDDVELAEIDADSISAMLRGESGPPGVAADDHHEVVGGGAAVEGETGGAVQQSPAVNAARLMLEGQVQLLEAPMPDDQVRARIASAAVVARASLAAVGCDEQTMENFSAVAARALDSLDPAALAAVLVASLQRLALPGESAAVSTESVTAPAAGAQSAAFLTESAAVPTESAAAPAAKEGGEPAAAASGERAGWVPRASDSAPGAWSERGTDRRASSSARVLKVDQGTVDRLLDLVGQLVVAKNGLPFLAVAAEEQWNARALGRQIKDQYGVVNRISEELQAAVMDVRMLPMSVAFARFPRMVRDLSRSLGKEVALEQEGDDTAADKDVIEMLGDPMVHLVRNCLDHGIEPPHERLALGKPAQATVRLSAAQEPDAVVIDIIDDGRGIDPERVKMKAYERGLITEEQVEGMSDQDAVNLVFRAGFSTAEKVSDLSGRGVGMDAVRASVEAMGGTVRLHSTPGQGCRVRLRLPLSMAVSRVLIVTVDGQRFGVPVDLVIETVRVPREQVARVEHQEVIVLRDTVVPLVDLGRTLQLSDDDAEDHTVSVLVTRPGGHDVGLVVDAFHEGAEVIVKPMEGVVAGARQFCGTALMGDGSVLLVLDVKEVLECP